MKIKLIILNIILGVFALCDNVKIGAASYALTYSTDSLTNLEKAAITNDLNNVFSLFENIEECVTQYGDKYYLMSEDFETGLPEDFHEYVAVKKVDNTFSFQITSEGAEKYKSAIQIVNTNQTKIDDLNVLLSNIKSKAILNWSATNKLALIHNAQKTNLNESNADIFANMLCNASPKMSSILEIQMSNVLRGTNALMAVPKARISHMGDSTIASYPMIYIDGKWKIFLSPF